MKTKKIIAIEKATLLDAGKILSLQKLAYQSEAKTYNDFNIPPITQTLGEIENDFNRQTVLKVVSNGEIIGSIRAFKKDGTCYIGRLFVHPDFQNQGIGTRLMNEIEYIFKTAERFELFTGHKSEKNIYLYKKLGYKVFKIEKITGDLNLLYMMKEQNSGLNKIELDRIAFYGRTLTEYLRIFNIDLAAWKGGKILDCPAGAASFVAEANRQGIQAVGCDPLFGMDLKTLIDCGKADIEHVTERTALVSHLFKWDFYPTVAVLREYRTSALQRFEADYPAGITEKRYIKAELPQLPFEDQSFDLVLSGHFLFTYGDKLDYAFHLASTLELSRVSSREVRIYPIQGLDAQPYKYFEKLILDLKQKGIIANIEPVPFEFQKGSNHMLRLIR